jgi:hypothetical protein
MFGEFNLKKIIIIAIIGAIIGFGLVLGFSFSPDVKQSFTPVPETFTELYFEDHLNLPKIVVPEQKNDFSFTIHNLEYKLVNYEAEITAIPENTPDLNVPLFKQTVALNHDQYKTIPVRFSLPALERQRVKVVVDLKNLNQTIHFWVDLDALVASPSATTSAEQILQLP